MGLALALALGSGFGLGVRVSYLPQPLNPDPNQALVTNVTSASGPQLKQSSLKVLGYICEEIDPDVLESQSNLILTAVIQVS